MKGLLIVVATIAMSDSSPEPTYKAAYQQHQQDGRPLVVLVGADWCSACRTMKSGALPQAAQDGALDQVAFATVNVDAQRELAGKLMRGDSIPQLIMFYRDGQGVHRIQLTGAQDAAAIASFVKQGTEAHTAAAQRQEAARPVISAGGS